MKEEIVEVSPVLKELPVKLEGMPAAIAISVVAVGAAAVCIYAIKRGYLVECPLFRLMKAA